MGTVSGISYYLMLIDISKSLIFTLVNWEKTEAHGSYNLSCSDALAISTTNKFSEMKCEWQRLMMFLKNREAEHHMKELASKIFLRSS